MFFAESDFSFAEEGIRPPDAGPICYKYETLLNNTKTYQKQ